MTRPFEEVFKAAIGKEPFPYQVRLATATDPPSRLSVATSAGKTAAAILSWIWRRRFAEAEIRQATPRRLVYCLPMRVLVEQTRDEAVKWLNQLGLLGGTLSEKNGYNAWAGSDDPEKIRVHVLLGGEVDRDWDGYPDRDAILIGTQDMLLSRALNRGYAMSRYRWPIQFGLLNNDVQWVMDEVQLMGSGLATTAQLQAFRRQLGTLGKARSLWMSATMREEWIDTIDVDINLDAAGAVELQNNDRSHPLLDRRLSAAKPVKRDDKTFNDAEALSELIEQTHRPGTRTLVILNTVGRAVALYEELVKVIGQDRCVLLHSHFRPPERQLALDRFLADPPADGMIGISTQVVEAGVDVSATNMITELAPWASLVQRFGRCNREGLDDNASIRVVIPADIDEKNALPYRPEELQQALDILEKVQDAGPNKLPPVEGELELGMVLRQRDLLDLFDTTADLSGADIDVSRFIREADERNVHVFWRDLKDQAPAATEPAPTRQELCSVPIGQAKNALGKKGMRSYRWDFLERRWASIGGQDYRPGMTLMLPASQGMYSQTLGFTGNKADVTSAIDVARPAEESDEDDHKSGGVWLEFDDHTKDVIETLQSRIDALEPEMRLPDDFRQALQAAARWHDVGKAHPVFQRSMLGKQPEENRKNKLWAKTELRDIRHERRGFRHELASAMAMLEHDQTDLAAYLAAAHHGRVRLSIRSLPHEQPPPEPNRLFARGVWDGETLPQLDLGGAEKMPETRLDLSPMVMGRGPKGPSWLARTLSLRDSPEIGPFRLTFLEALLRISDWQASQMRKPKPEEKEHA
jgi:CRISPR-associated endonuclease/helicase Cas3